MRMVLIFCSFSQIIFKTKSKSGCKLLIDDILGYDMRKFRPEFPESLKANRGFEIIILE